MNDHKTIFTPGQCAWAMLLFWILISSLESIPKPAPDAEYYLPAGSRIIDSAKFDVIPFGQNRISKPVLLRKQPNAKWSTSYVYALRNLDLGAMREYLERLGFRDLEGMNLNQLRHLYGAWAYDPFLSEVSTRSGLPKSVVFSFFIYEATEHGIETDLFRLYLNPGGVKYSGVGESVAYEDDCGSTPCDFVRVGSVPEAVEMWAQTLNLSRYIACKDSTPEQICRCIIQSGYSTNKNWRGRAELCRTYESFLKKFPKYFQKDLTS